MRKSKRKLFRKPQQYDDTNNTPEVSLYLCKLLLFVIKVLYLMYTNVSFTKKIFFLLKNDESLLQYFVCKRVKYVWDSESASYIPLRLVVTYLHLFKL